MCVSACDAACECPEFADMTWEEFKESRLAKMQNCSAQKGSPKALLRGNAKPAVPVKVWRLTFLVTAQCNFKGAAL